MLIVLELVLKNNLKLNIITIRNQFVKEDPRSSITVIILTVVLA